MIYEEVRWIRAGSEKLCPQLRKVALEWYRPRKYLPCFIQKPFKFLKQRWRKVHVIVQLEETRGFSSLRENAANLGCRIDRELPIINSFSTRVNAKKLEFLTQNYHVKKIWHDREFRAVLDVASPAVHAPALWERGITGKGVVVAVIDTGIYNHPDLSGRIVGFKDLVNQKSSPYDDNGHGTHVSGDVASSGLKSDFNYRGPAPEAVLVGVKVLDKNGSGSMSTVIEGIQWCLDTRNAFGIRALNLSLGSPASESYVNDPVCQAVEKAWQAGIVVCVAAGNEGPQPRTISSPGIDPVVITVGALNDFNTMNPDNDQVASFSSRGPTVDELNKPDIIAPGVNIISLRSPGSQLDKQNRNAKINSFYTSLSGTSMATPVCCGVVAQMLQLNSALTPDQVKSALMQTAKTLNLDPNAQGAGVIDVERAAASVMEAAHDAGGATASQS